MNSLRIAKDKFFAQILEEACKEKLKNFKKDRQKRQWDLRIVA